MPCVKRPLIVLFVFISLLWVPRLHAESHFSSCTDGTGNIFNATVVVTEQSLGGLTGGTLAAGSEIAVYSDRSDGADVCVGKLTWTGSTAAIAIWGNDAYSQIEDGLNPGESFHFRIYDNSSGQELGNDVFSVSFSVGDSLYVHDGVYVLESLTLLQQKTTVSVSMREGWNLVGIDRDVTDSDYRTLFPSSVEQTLFRFDGNYVQQTDATMTSGVGYWLRMDSSTNVEIEGIAKNEVTLDLRSGWNLISGPGCAAILADAPDPGNILIDNTLFQFNGSYSAATELQPGRSYWVRAREAGTIDVACPGISSRITSAGTGLAPTDLTFGKASGSLATGEPIPYAFSTGGAQTAVVFVRDNRNTAQIEVGVHPDASDNFELEFDLLAPPIPPVGAFDARSRIGAEDYLVDVRSSNNDQLEYTILYRAEPDQGPIVLTWDRSRLSALGEYMIVDNVTGDLFGPLDMSSVDSLDISTTGGLLDSGLRIIYKPSIVFAPAPPEIVEPQLFAVDVPTAATFQWGDASANRYHIQVTAMTDPMFDSVVFEDSTLVTNQTEFAGLDVSTNYIWRIRAENEGGFSEWSPIVQFTTSSVQSTPVDQHEELPESVVLGQNYPNPFNPTTTINFELSAAQDVSLRIYDMTGREIQTLVNDNRSAGRHEIRWDAARYSSGAYVYRLQVGSVVKTKTMMLMK